VEGRDAATRDILLGHGRRALVKAIVREGIRGRSFGASTVQVHMEVDGRVSDFEVADTPPAVPA
jgi:hypothetical protein